MVLATALAFGPPDTNVVPDRLAHPIIPAEQTAHPVLHRLAWNAPVKEHDYRNRSLFWIKKRIFARLRRQTAPAFACFPFNPPVVQYGMRISTRPIPAPGALFGVLIVGVAVAYLAFMRDPVPKVTISSPTAAPPTTQSETPWLREISIRVDRFGGPSGVPAADDFVDILLFRTNDGQQVSSVIMRAIRVIAADHAGGTGNTSPSGLMVIVEVDTYQAQELAIAQQAGALVLVSHKVSLLEDPKPRDLFQRGPYRMGKMPVQRGPYRMGKMPVIPYGDYTQPPSGGILH